MVTEQVALKSCEYTYKHCIEKIYHQLHIRAPEFLDETQDSEFFRDKEQIITKEEYMAKFDKIDEKVREL